MNSTGFQALIILLAPVPISIANSAGPAVHGPAAIQHSGTPVAEAGPATQGYRHGLTFYVPFDGTLNAAFSAGDGRIANPSPEFTYTDGIAGRGVVVHENKKSPIPEFSAAGNFGSEQGTIAYWFQPSRHSRLDADAATRGWFLASRQRDIDSPHRRFYLFCGPDSVFFDYFVRAKHQPWPPGSWHHIAIRWNPDALSIFVDGRLAEEQTVKTGWNWGFGRSVFLGGLQKQPRCAGVYDEVVGWNRPLDAAEVALLYRTGRSGRPFSTLVGTLESTNSPAGSTQAVLRLNAIENGSFEAGRSNALMINIPQSTSPTHATFITESRNSDIARITDDQAYHGRRAMLLSVGTGTSAAREPQSLNSGTAGIRTLAFRLDPTRRYVIACRLKVLTRGPIAASIELEGMRSLENPPAMWKNTRTIAGSPTKWVRMAATGRPFAAHDDLYRLRIDIVNRGAESASVLLDALQVSPLDVAGSDRDYFFDDAVTASLYTEKTANIFDSSERVVVFTGIANQGDVPAAQSLSFSVFNLWNEKVFERTLSTSLSRYEHIIRGIDLGLFATGMYRAIIYRRDCDDVIDEITFSVLPHLVQLDTLGVHAVADDYVLAVAHRLGIRWNRLWDNGRPTDWPNVQPQSPTQYDWEYSDGIVDKMRAHGFDLLGVISWPQVSWARNWVTNTRPHWMQAKWGKEAEPRLDPMLLYDDRFRALWLAYVRNLVTHYDGRITRWELLNEPYLYASPEWVADIYKFTVPVIRSANPRARIVGPSAYFRPTWVAELIELGILHHIDAFSYHGYSLTSAALSAVNGWARADGRRRLVFDTENSAQSSSRLFCQSCLGTEFSGYVSPQESAIRIVKNLVRALGEGTNTFFYYWMVPYDVYDKHGSFLDHSGRLRASAVAYALTGWRLRDLKPDSKATHRGGIESYTFLDPEEDRAVAIVWPAGDSVLPSLDGVNRDGIIVFNIMGGRIDQESDTSPVLAIPGMPVIFEAESPEKLRKAIAEFASSRNRRLPSPVN